MPGPHSGRGVNSAATRCAQSRSRSSTCAKATGCCSTMRPELGGCIRRVDRDGVRFPGQLRSRLRDHDGASGEAAAQRRARLGRRRARPRLARAVPGDAQQREIGKLGGDARKCRGQQQERQRRQAQPPAAAQPGRGAQREHRRKERRQIAAERQRQGGDQQARRAQRREDQAEEIAPQQPSSSARTGGEIGAREGQAPEQERELTRELRPGLRGGARAEIGLLLEEQAGTVRRRVRADPEVQVQQRVEGIAGRARGCAATRAPRPRGNRRRRRAARAARGRARRPAPAPPAGARAPL